MRLCLLTTSTLSSIRQARCLLEVGIIRQLSQHEVSDIGTRDAVLDRLVGMRKAMPVSTSVRSVGQVSRAGNRPIQMAFSNTTFLTLVVGEDVPQRERNDDVLKEEGEIIPAISNPVGR